jgi:hypothetical protein
VSGVSNPTGAIPESTPGEGHRAALRVVAYLNALSAHKSATASEIAEALHWQGHTLDQMIEINRVCNLLCEVRILMRGREGYGYQSA